MLLPSGTLKALKGHVDAVAVVVLFCLAMGALVERVQPWPVVVGLALTCWSSHFSVAPSTATRRGSLISRSNKRQLRPRKSGFDMARCEPPGDRHWNFNHHNA
jgi:hypothetical protein